MKKINAIFDDTSHYSTSHGVTQCSSIDYECLSLLNGAVLVFDESKDRGAPDVDNMIRIRVNRSRIRINTIRICYLPCHWTSCVS